MIRQRLLFSGLLTAAFCVLFVSGNAVAGDYVWARTNWGASNINARYGSMSNGYGGYYVPRIAHGNNYEGRPFMNPNGYIVPANGGQYSGTYQNYVPVVPVQPTNVQKPVVVPQATRLQPNVLPSNTVSAAQNSTVQTAPVSSAPMPVK